MTMMTMMVVVVDNSYCAFTKCQALCYTFYAFSNVTLT